MLAGCFVQLHVPDKVFDFISRGMMAIDLVTSGIDFFMGGKVGFDGAIVIIENSLLKGGRHMDDISEGFLADSGLDKRAELSQIGRLGRLVVIFKLFDVHSTKQGNLLLFF